MKVHQVATNGICGSLIPIIPGFSLLCRKNFNESSPKTIKAISMLNMTMQGGRVELAQKKDAIEIGIYAIADMDVHQTILARQRNCRLAPMLGQGREPRTSPSTHNYAMYDTCHEIKSIKLARDRF